MQGRHWTVQAVALCGDALEGYLADGARQLGPGDAAGEDGRLWRPSVRAAGRRCLRDLEDRARRAIVAQRDLLRPAEPVRESRGELRSGERRAEGGRRLGEVQRVVELDLRQ